MLEARQALLISRDQLLVILKNDNNHALKQLSTRAEKLTRSFDNFKRIGEAEFKIAELESVVRRKKIAELESAVRQKRISELKAKLAAKEANAKRIAEAKFKISELEAKLAAKEANAKKIAELAKKAPKRCVTFNDVVEYRYF